ncbi:MAG: response regulator [Candidatus Nanopelagicales bacterium]|nr:response regulator [Candidatus Nanopelagicales bacterium]
MGEKIEHDAGRQVYGARRVLVVEDEDFTRTAVTQLLESGGLSVVAVANAADALSALATHDPHVLLTDLDLGPGPNGVDLARRVASERPWVGIVVLTAHKSVHLAVSDREGLPLEAVMLVKSQLTSMADIEQAIDLSISQVGQLPLAEVVDEVYPVLSSVQADTLRLMAQGLSNAGIAERRGTTLRAAEASVQRTLHALGIESRPDMNSRVLAVRMWQAGEVSVR